MIVVKSLKRIVLALVLIASLYLLAALAGSLIPVNNGFSSPDDGIELFIETNGVHTGIIMPVVSDLHDWRTLIRPGQLGGPTRYGSHILVGWGHAGVYRHAQNWQDLRAADAISAVVGSDDVLLHVHHLNYPRDYPDYRRSFKVSEAEYRQIAQMIEAQFVLDNAGAPIAEPGYGTNDIFYQAKGRYSAFHTCNNWTGNILKNAGIKVGIWTPFSGGVMRWFDVAPA